MLLNNVENEKLFAKTVPVSLRDVYTNQTRTNHLFLTMEWQDASAGMYSKKELVISLTDNNDPFFLYNLHLSEEDFQMLKTNQELLINFATFPQHIIGYIEKSLMEEKNPQPKFLLVFTINAKLGNIATSSQFDIIETNQFKNLTHLSLQFVAASDSAIKQYISSYFRKLKEENKQLQMNLNFSEQDKKDKLTAKEHALNNKEQELELLRTQFNAELTMKDSKHSQQLQEERNQLLQKLKDEEDRHEKERKEKDHNFRREIQQLESRLNVLDTLNKELQDQNYKHESTIRQLRSTVLSSEDEIKRLNNSIQSYQLKCDNLQSELKDKQSRINRLDEDINRLEQEIRSKTHSIAKLNQQIESEIGQKESLELEMVNVKLQLETSERTIRMLNKEKEELNDVIFDLQEKMKKFKSKAELATKYKQTIEEKEKLLTDIKKETEGLNHLLDAKNDEAKYFKESINVLERKIVSLEDEGKRKAQILSWMSHQLTENNIFPQYTRQMDPDTSPSNIAQKQLARISCSAGQNSPGFENSPSGIASNKTASKSVRPNTPSPALRKNSSGPSRYHNTGATDSAYATSPSGFTNQATPENIYGVHIMNHDPGADFDIDHEALNAAFGQGDHVLKHSTAKKPAKPVKSVTPKVSKKR